MDKAYNAQQHEDNQYAAWEQSGFFNPDNLPERHREPYAVMMPPPNVTGVLHLGHALENTIMDAHVRYQRMRGKKVLLMPGTDHAAVATQARVEDNLKKSGMVNPRQELGREGLLEKIRAYAEQSKSTILSQVRKMGTSADWSRLAYTFDETRSKAVNELFIRMYNDGLIYRGYRVVNWSIVGQSTSSDDELEYTERETTLYTFRYAKDFPISIATVLPETKLGDTAVAVHPDDPRYRDFIGKVYTVDIGAAEPLQIHIIGDEAVDPAFGTGAVGVTPAHSQTDFEIYQRHPDIGLKHVVGTDGTMTKLAGRYAGLPYKEARTQFVEWLRAEGLLQEEKPLVHNVALSDRFKDEIYAMPMEQWFVSIDREIPGRGKSLKQLMKEAIGNGLNSDPTQKVTIVPERFARVCSNWVDNYRDWCISRQIWWGHRIPVWYRGEEVVASAVQPEGDGWKQDEDTLDTWFSSASWTFSTLGWPEHTKDLQTFHPTAWMQMGHEIIFLWLVRMILMSTYALQVVPFRNVYIHGILRDKQGRKFSKSLGNGIDPLDVIKEYGTDALRFSLIKGIAPGSDARFYEDKVADARNFVNKLWNVSRFIAAQEVTAEQSTPSLADHWILSRLHTLVQELTAHHEAYEFSPIAEKSYDFVWHEFADWYIEMAKLKTTPSIKHREVLYTVLALLHPVIPFVTDTIAREIKMPLTHGALIVAEWPKANAEHINPELEKRMAMLQQLVTDIRNLRREYRIAPGQQLDVFSTEMPEEEKALVSHLARVQFVAERTHTTAAHIVTGNWKLTMPLDGVIDVAHEKKRIETHIAEIQTHCTSVESKLNNEKFMANARQDIVEQTRALYAQRQDELAQLKKSLAALQ